MSNLKKPGAGETPSAMALMVGLEQDGYEVQLAWVRRPPSSTMIAWQAAYLVEQMPVFVTAHDARLTSAGWIAMVEAGDRVIDDSGSISRTISVVSDVVVRLGGSVVWVRS
jgi:hypothetical protein